MLAAGVTAIIAFLAAFGPLIAPQDPTSQTSSVLVGFGVDGHLLGTDGLGRDEFSRILAGAQPIVLSSGIAVLLAAIVGFTVGLIAGYRSGPVGGGLMRTMDAVLSFPIILLAIVIVSALGLGIKNLTIAIAISQVPVFARLVHALTLREERREYVLAARATGFSSTWIMWREITPNVLGPLIVQATSVLAVVCGYVAALSYLGFGTSPETANWGYMVKDGQEYLFGHLMLSLLPGALITAFVLACTFLGDALDDRIRRGASQR